ncbi:MAG: GNAT family N-acetyltransferase [Lachnospiraceae bacterium]|nr:GNAT family N-acetyltransferase [Lachnospiraceae bacterium]
MNITLEEMSFDNCQKAYDIDRSDIPYSFVEDVDTLISTLRYGAENDLIGHAYLAKYDDRYIATIMIGEGISGDADPLEVQNIPFYRLMFFVIDKSYRGQGLGTAILNEAIDRIYQEFGKRPLVIEVQNENENAARFYERNGFVKTKYTVGDDRYYIRGLKI